LFAGIFGLFLHTIATVIVAITFVDLNPFAGFIMASPRTRLNLLKLLLKLLLPLGIALDSNVKIYLRSIIE
jgi:hypothetical protein